MKIRNQNWETNSIYLILYLKEPYWSAWQRFGWTEGTEGYSISKEAYEKARDLKKKILVKNKYGDYEITPSKASRYLHCEFIARDEKPLICIPKDAFKKLPDKREEFNTAGWLSSLTPEQVNILRKKLGLPTK